MNEKCLLVIPAIKKNASIPDQLVKKLQGVTLIQRSINIALELINRKNILIVTDSEEISLISQRNEINFYYDVKLESKSNNLLTDLKDILKLYVKNFDHLIIFRPNTPLINSEDIQSAYKLFLDNNKSIIVSVKETFNNQYTYKAKRLELINTDFLNKIFEEVQAFIILDSFNVDKVNLNTIPYVLPYEKSIEIKTYQDWWVCEKVLARKKILFNVVGSNELGMGHIYHSLSLAHEITDHEIIFVCDEKYEIAVEKIASMDYKVLPSSNIINTILEEKPNLVINDILNTDKMYIELLKQNEIKVVNFEDLGEGARIADLVFNELYDIPQFEGNNCLWGYKYMTLRDEFENAIPHVFNNDIDSILITFGGTDQNNLTLVTLQSIIDIARSKEIKIYIVCGGGYLFKEELNEYIKLLNYKHIELTYASGVISKIMEKTSLAFSSNGRTVYELADMNIPSIIISHHEREASHTFAKLERGFINLGVYNKGISEKLIAKSFIKIIEDNDYRKLLYLNIKKYKFRDNKIKVVKKILDLL